MDRKIIYILLILILLLFIRFYQFGTIPEGLHADEAVFGYNAYSILKTGSDEYGKSWPLTFSAFGYKVGAVYLYLTIPFIWLFGLSELAVRMPSAVAGLFIFPAIFYFIKEFLHDKRLALIGAAVVSISPPLLFLSRVQSDPLVAALFMISGVTPLLRFLRTNFIGYAILSLTLFTFAIFTHQLAAYLIVPLFIITCGYIGLKKLLRFAKVIVMMLVLLITISFYMFKITGQRAGDIGFVMHPKILIPLNKSISQDGLGHAPLTITRIFHNKLSAHVRGMIIQSAAYWSPEFLFLQAGEPLRERVADTGFLHFLEIPILIIGLYLGIRRYRRETMYLLLWLLIGTLIISLAVDESPNIHRFFYVAFPLYLFLALGVSWLWQQRIKYFQLKINGRVVVILLYATSLILYFHQLLIHQPTLEPYFRGFAYRELVRELESLKKSYDLIVFTKAQSAPYIYLLFYTKYDPVVYQASGSRRDLDYQRLDNYLFVPEECPFTDPNLNYLRTGYSGSMLFVNRGGCKLPEETKVLNRIKWRDGMEAFQLLEYKATGSADLEYIHD